MKKHIIRILTVLLLVCLGAALFAACGETETPQKETYTVTYAAGGGTGTGPASEKYEEGATFKVKENSFTRDGYTFKTWNDGTKDYAAGATYTMPKKDVTFTAQWTEDGGKPEPAAKVTVTYSLGENTTGKAPAAQEVDKGGQVTLPAAPVWEGHTFKGWKVGSDATLKNAGDKITVNENVTVTAQWETAATPVEKVTVTFNLGDNTTGKVPAAQEVEKGKAYTLPAAPDWEGHLFTGWKVGETDEVKKAGETITPNADVTLTAQYKEVSHTITGATIEADEDNQAVYVTIIGSYTGYTEVEIATLLEDDDQSKLCVSICLGEDPWTYQELDFTVDADDDTHVFSVSLDVTDLEGSIPFFICENRSGSGDIKTLSADINVSVTLGSKAYTLVNGKSSTLTLTVGEAGKEYAFTSMGLETATDKIYFVVNGTYTGYSDAEFKAALEDGDLKNLAIGINNQSNWQWPNCATTVTATDGAFTVKLDITEVEIGTYTVCENQSGVGDIKWNEAFAATATFNSKKYTIERQWAGGSEIKIEAATPEPPVEGTVDVVGADIAVDEGAQKVYLTLTGTFTGYSEAELKALFEGTNTYYVHFWDEKADMENPTSVVVTTEGGNWTAKCDVTDLKAGELRNVLCNGELKLDIQDKTVTLGNKTFTLQKANGYGNTGLKVVVETAPTDPVYEVTAFTIEKQADEKVYLIYKGTCANYEQAALEAALKALPLRFDVIKAGGGGNTGAEGNGWTFAMNGGTWEMKLNITVGDNGLFTVGGTYFIDNLNDYNDGGKYFDLWNTEVVVELGTNKYKAGGPLTEPNTWGNVTFTIEGEPSTYAFERPTSARLEVKDDKGNGTDENFSKDIARAFFVISGSYTGEVTEAIAKEYFKFAAYPFEFGAYTSTKDRTRRISIDTEAHTYTVMFDVTWLPAGEHYCRFNAEGGDGDLRLSLEACPNNTMKSVGSTYTLTNYNGTDDHWGCIVLKVERNYAVTGADLEEVDGKANLVVNGTFDASAFTGEQIEKFLKDEDIRSMCVTVYPYLYPTDENYHVTITTTEGTFTVKLDLSVLTEPSYGILSDGSGYGDIKNVTVNKTLTVGNKVYTLTGTDGGNCTLTVAEIQKTFTLTEVTLEMSEDSSKAYVVMKATYTGYTQEELLTLAYVDGEKTITAESATIAEGVATVKFNFTNAEAAWWWGHYKFGDGNAVDIKVNVQQQSVYVNGKQIVLFYHKGNGMAVLEVINTQFAVLNAQLVQESDKVYLVLTAYNDANYTEEDLKTFTYIGEYDNMTVTVQTVTVQGKNVTLKFDISEIADDGNWWWGHYTIKDEEKQDLKGGFEASEFTYQGKKYSIFNNDSAQIIFSVENV